MRSIAKVVLGIVAIADVWGLAQLRDAQASPAVPSLAARPAFEAREAVPLAFNELFAPTPELRPSEKTLGLAGKHVRIVGFMAQMELAPHGGFYLTPRPVRCDEAGGGTGDLPPENVLVLARSADGKEVPFTPGALEVRGVLEVGNREDDQGRVSAFRLRLDAPVALELATNAQR